MAEPEALPTADAPGDEEPSAPPRGLVALRLGDVRFGLWVDEVLEIIRTPPISRLPIPSPEIAGVTAVRGDLVPVLDLGTRLMGEAAVRPGRLVLVRDEESGTMVGLLVDAVETLMRVRDDQIEAPPRAAASGLAPDVVAGVVAHEEGVVTILRLGRVAAPPRAKPTGGRVR